MFAIALSLAAGCGKNNLPAKDSKEYLALVKTFYVGLAALQVGDDVRAEDKLGQATKIAAGEPASWADWGILALRQRNFDVAAQRLATARDLVPQNDRIYYLLGLLESTAAAPPKPSPPGAKPSSKIRKIFAPPINSPKNSNARATTAAPPNSKN